MTAIKGFAHLDASTGKLLSTEAGAAGSTEIVLSGAGGWSSITSGATGPNKQELATNKVNIQTLDFADSASKLFAEWTVVMPSNYNGGTVTAIFLWTANSVSTNSVVWGLQGRAYGDDITIDQAMGTAQEVTDANTATANQIHISAASAAITLAGAPAAGQMVQFRAYRDSANGSDTLAATALLVAIKVTYTAA